jgi:hypothetical protein
MHRKFKLCTGVAGTAAAVIELAGGCVYKTPAVGAGSVLADVATVSSNNVWAVGTDTDSGGHSHALIEHFDGHAWSISFLPYYAGAGLTSITAVSATDIWAVGNGHTAHWTGRMWSTQSFPDPGGLVVSVVEHGHGGLVMGLAQNPVSGKPEVVTHAPAGWQPAVIPTPPVPTSGRPCDHTVNVGSLTVETQNDLWVAGSVSNPTNNQSPSCPYLAHWNGSAWSTYAVASPPGTTGGGLSAISARSSNDVWAVGYAQGQDANSQSFFDSGIAVHWNGQSWQNVCGTYCGSIVNDVDARGDGVWAVGSDGGNSSQNYFMQIQRWTGTGWARQVVQKVNVVKPPNANSWLNFLTGVSSSGGTVASVGYFVEDGSRNGFVLGGSPSGNVEKLAPLVDVRPDK